MNKKFADMFQLLAFIVFLTVLVLMLATIASGQVIYQGYRYGTDGTYLSVHGRCSCRMCNLARSYNYQVNQNIQAAQLARQRRLAETAATPLTAVRQVLPLFQLDEATEFLEVGCGSGTVLIEATKKYRCRAVGIEIDTELANRAAVAVRESGANATILHGDALEYNGYAGRVVYAYLFPDLLGKLRPKLEYALQVVTYMHPVPGMEGAKHLVRVDGKAVPVYVWRAPKMAIPSVPQLRSK